jgi:hypothetical protein
VDAVWRPAQFAEGDQFGILLIDRLDTEREQFTAGSLGGPCCCRPMPLGSEPVENLVASYPPAAGPGRDPSYSNGCRADKAPGPDRVDAAV